MLAALACLPGCGPSTVLDRTPLASEQVRDGGGSGGDKRDAPISLPGSTPPPGNNQPPSTVDPVGFSDGFNCKEDKECRTQRCVDGVCCQTACDGACESCDQPGAFGKCQPVPDGQDPDDECADEGVASCGRDGACNGAGMCRRYPANTMCEAGGCDNAIERAARLCDGNGTCMPASTKACAPAECLGEACGPPCMNDPDCPAGRWCDKGTCRTQLEPGTPCERAAQCATNFCTDGVCCNMDCKDGCYACDLPGSVGTCKAVPTGGDPDRECPTQAIGTCGNNGGCNGRGACLKHPMGTWCGYGQCMNGTQYGDSTCDGMGGCKRGPGKSCGAYACNGNLVCWNACANAAQCAPGRHCNIHTCQ